MLVFSHSLQAAKDIVLNRFDVAGKRFLGAVEILVDYRVIYLLVTGGGTCYMGCEIIGFHIRIEQNISTVFKVKQIKQMAQGTCLGSISRKLGKGHMKPYIF